MGLDQMELVSLEEEEETLRDFSLFSIHAQRKGRMRTQ